MAARIAPSGTLLSCTTSQVNRTSASVTWVPSEKRASRRRRNNARRPLPLVSISFARAATGFAVSGSRRIKLSWV